MFDILKHLTFVKCFFFKVTHFSFLNMNEDEKHKL